MLPQAVQSAATLNQSAVWAISDFCLIFVAAKFRNIAPIAGSRIHDLDFYSYLQQKERVGQACNAPGGASRLFVHGNG